MEVVTIHRKITISKEKLYEEPMADTDQPKPGALPAALREGAIHVHFPEGLLAGRGLPERPVECGAV